jgi:predicted nucleotidyltransferase
MEQKVILQAICGSQAYGLATEDSDVDRHGIFVASTSEVLSVHGVGTESIVTTDPDIQLHEVGKFCRLAIKCNPTVSETLWMNDYEIMTPEGKRLVVARKAFLSAPAVRASYIGYAVAQGQKLVKRESEGLEGYGPELKKRKAKHQRHLVRLCWQCKSLLETGEMMVRIEDRDLLFEMGEWSTERISAWFEDARYQLDHIDSVLPDHPDIEWVNDILLEIRNMN